MATGCSVDELGGDAQAVAQPAHAALEQILYAELTAGSGPVGSWAAIAERRVAGEHVELTEARELGYDVLGDAVAEVLLFRIAAHVDEREHGDRRSVVREFGHRNRYTRHPGHAVDPN